MNTASAWQAAVRRQHSSQRQRAKAPRLARVENSQGCALSLRPLSLHFPRSESLWRSITTSRLSIPAQSAWAFSEVCGHRACCVKAENGVRTRPKTALGTARGMVLSLFCPPSQTVRNGCKTRSIIRGAVGHTKSISLHADLTVLTRRFVDILIVATSRPNQNIDP